MVEVFRRRVIRLLVERELLNEDFARSLLSWKHPGFSIDNSARVLAEYIARPPISLKKIRYEPFKGKVLFHTKYSEYFKQNVHLFDALDFLAELTQHIPPMRLQLIRRYGLYTYRTKGWWEEIPWCRDRSWRCGPVGPHLIRLRLRYDPYVIAVIEDPDELGRILRHPGCRAGQQPQAATRLLKMGRSPPGLDPDRLN